MERDKPDSLLTDTQRHYLRGNSDGLSDDAERMKRSRIRKRLRAGIEDFDIVFNYLEAGDRTQLVAFDHSSKFATDTEKKEELQDSQVFAEGLMSMIAFATQCADDIGIEPEDLFQASLQRMPQVESADVTVDCEMRGLFSPDFFEGRLDRLQEQFEKREHLSTTEIQMLFDRERITSSDVNAYFEEMEDPTAD